MLLYPDHDVVIFYYNYIFISIAERAVCLCNTDAATSGFSEVLPCSTAEKALSRICWLSALRFCYVQRQKSFHMVPGSPPGPVSFCVCQLWA